MSTIRLSVDALPQLFTARMMAERSMDGMKEPIDLVLSRQIGGIDSYTEISRFCLGEHS